MPSLIISNIKLLAGIHSFPNALRGAELADMPSIKNAYLIIEDEEIAGFGSMDELKNSPAEKN